MYRSPASRLVQRWARQSLELARARRRGILIAPQKGRPPSGPPGGLPAAIRRRR